MFLEQIERRQQDLQDQQDVGRPEKIIALKLPAHVHDQLERLAKKEGLKSKKEALRVAMRAGLASFGV